MKNQSDKALAQSADLGSLIEQLGPLNNRWRDGSQAEKVLTLWDMGEVLLKSAPYPLDALLWEIQGSSYLTRNLLRYALIVRRGWEDRKQLEQLTRGLRSFTLFREALPFLKGDREEIDEDTHTKVVAQLSNPDTRAAAQYLKKLKAQKIGRQHKKGAGVSAIQDQAVRFERALAELENEAVQTASANASLSADALIALSQITMAIATGDEIKELPAAVTKAPDHLSALVEPLTTAARGGRAGVAAFRKAVGAERLMLAADLLNSLRSAESLAEWRRRRGIKPPPLLQTSGSQT
jgi:hypothetical protein